MTAVFLHASHEHFQAGDLVEKGHAPNFSDEPSGYVFFCDSMKAAEWWHLFLTNPEIHEDPEEAFIYEVIPTGIFTVDDGPGTIGGELCSVCPLLVLREIKP